MKKILTLIILSCPIFLFGADSVSMTTYYPVPSAVYSEVRADTASLASTNTAVLQIGSSSHTVVLDVAGSGTFSGELELGSSTDAIFASISEDLSVNASSASSGTYNILVSDDGGLAVDGTTNFNSQTANANVGTGAGIFYGDLATVTTTVGNETKFYGDTFMSGLLEVDDISTPGFTLAFFTEDATWATDGYDDLPQFPLLPDAADCTGGRTPNLTWTLWGYRGSGGESRSLTVLALSEVCDTTGTGGGGSIPGGGSTFIASGGEEEE